MLEVMHSKSMQNVSRDLDDTATLPCSGIEKQEIAIGRDETDKDRFETAFLT